MNKKVLVFVLIAVLVVGAAAVGYGAYRVAQKGSEQDRRVEVITLSRGVDDKLEEIWERLKNRDKAWDSAASGSGTGIESMWDLTESDVEGIAELIDTARADAKKIPSEEVANAYVAVCDSLSDSIQTSSDGVEKSKPIAEAYNIVLTCYNDDRTAHSAIGNSVDACNRDKWSEGKKQAQAAEKSFAAVKSKLVKVHELFPDDSIKTAYAYPEAGIAMAKLQYELAVLGSQGSVNGYNAKIDKLDAQEKKLFELAPQLESVQDVLWADVQIAYGRFETRANPANGLWVKAKNMVSEGAF